MKTLPLRHQRPEPESAQRQVLELVLSLAPGQRVPVDPDTMAEASLVHLPMSERKAGRARQEDVDAFVEKLKRWGVGITYNATTDLYVMARPPHAQMLAL